MANILNSADFGLKLYNKFPPKYREDDEGQNLALKRYLQALSDGGYKHSIDEINGLTYIIDPDKADSSILPLLFKQYGLEIFNGIPENYLRYLLPKLGTAWSKKGSLSVVEFVTTSLSGIKTTTEVKFNATNSTIVRVTLDMDYNIGNYFPEASQFTRLLKNFIPFYCDLILEYSYLFLDGGTISNIESFVDILTMFGDESSEFSVEDSRVDSFSSSAIEDSIGIIQNSVDVSCTNRTLNTLNGSFYTNTLYAYDLVKKGEKTEIVY